MFFNDSAEIFDFQGETLVNLAQPIIPDVCYLVLIDYICAFYFKI